MEIGGLMAEAFKLFLGNSDVAVFLATLTLFIGLVFTINRVTVDFEE